MSYFKKQINEIVSDNVLILTGLFIAIAHLITAHSWINNEVWELFVSSNHRIMCFPFYKNCKNLAMPTAKYAQIVLYSYALTSLITSLLFLFKKYVKYAIYGLLFLFFLKTSILFSRYNLMGNYHTMHLLINMVFLCFSQKRLTMTVFLCIFYFCAGLLKLNEEWMSGASLMSAPILTNQYLIFSLAYVIVLELILIWGLLFPNKYLRIVTLLQLFVFHAFSYTIVGYFYPSIMFCILSVVWLPLLLDEKYSPDIKLLDWPNLLACFLLLFVNIYPKFIYDDTSLHGDRRFLRFHMLDAKTTCNKIFLIKSQNHISNITLPKMTSAVRIWCDPVSYQALTQTICEELNHGETLQVYIESKRSTDKKYTTVWDDKDVCSN